jgi:hypothetical protein
MVYDYKLATDGEGQLTVSQYAYNGDISIASGSLYIENGQLIASGISRATPTPPQDAPPTGTPSPDAIDAGDAAAAPVPGAPVITRGATVTRKQNTGGTDAGSVPAKARTAETTMYEGILEVTKALHEYSAGLNGGIKYIAFDLTNIPQDERGETDEFADYLKKWAESLKLEPLFGTYDDMVEAGYIIPITPDTLSEAGFTEGVRFSFRDVELEGNVLTLNVVKYRGPLGVMGADYTAKFEDGVWTVGEPENVLVA